MIMIGLIFALGIATLLITIPSYECLYNEQYYGNWTLSRNPEQECIHEFLCSELNYTWYGFSNTPLPEHSDIDYLSKLESMDLVSYSNGNALADTGDLSTLPITSGILDDDRGHSASQHSEKDIGIIPSRWKVYNTTTACEVLAKKGIKKIFFHGDSYMRQMYTGLLILLRGNYRNGSLIEDPGSKGCEYFKQLYEKRCGVQQLDHNGYVCDGKVRLEPVLSVPNNARHCTPNEKNVVLVSFGNHKTRSGNGGRWGVNNATIYQEFFDDNTCPGFRDNTNNNCSIYWVSTHYRLVGWFGDETPEVIKQYNEDMKEYFMENKCGDVGYIDVYNMTRQLVLHHHAESHQMTFDKVHWGFQVNLLKAQILLNTLINRRD